MKVQSNKGKNKLFLLSLATTLVLFVVNSSGFVDTLTGSTSGCGRSWPLCNGSITPWTWDIHAWIEFGHRFLVFMVTVLLLTLSVAAWRKYGSVRKVKVMVSLAIAGLVLESGLGALSVFFVNPPALMATHMGVALMSFGALVILTMTIRRLDRPDSEVPALPGRKLSRLIRFTLVYLYLAIYFGAYVTSTGAGYFFRGFPFPTEGFAFSPRVFWIDIAHRSIALGMIVFLAVIAVWAYRIRKTRRDLYAGSLAALALVGLQGFSGALLIYTHLNIMAVMLHVSVASLLFGTACLLAERSAAKFSKPAAIPSINRPPRAGAAAYPRQAVRQSL